MRVLITGVAGFIGSTIADALISRFNAHVVGVDNMWWGFEENVNPQIVFKNLDILNTAKLVYLMKGIDLVIHCAASLEVSLGQADPSKDLKINTMGTISVLEAMKQAGVSRLINFSSACAYGMGEYGMSPVSEEEAIVSSPQWSYGSSKLSAEIYCNQYAKTYGMHIVNVRPGIVCGPREWYGRAMTIFIKRALSGKDCVVFGEGREERDFVHIADVTNLVIEIAKNIDMFDYTVFNAGTGSATKIYDVACFIANKYGVKLVQENVKQGEISNLVKDRVRLPFEMRSMRLSMRKASADLGFVSRYKIHNIIEDLAAWHINNKARWDVGWKV